MTSSKIAAVVLGAGKGTRMKSDLPKVLMPICGKPMIRNILDTLDGMDADKIVGVTAPDGELVRKEVAPHRSVIQQQQLGTGDAVMAAAPVLEGFDGDVLTIFGDHPIITKETFLKAVRWLDSCGGFQGAFRPFLYKIAKNICIDLNRTMKRTEVSLESLPDEPAYQESGFAAAEEKANLRALTAQLEPEQRELVLLRFAQQLKLREIAQITGLPLRTVQSRLRAALKTLKMQLEKEDWR